MQIIDVILEMLLSLSGKAHRSERGALFLAGALGAITPLAVPLLLAENFPLAGDAAATTRAIFIVGLPAVVLGALLGGILGQRSQEKSHGNQAYLVAFIWGFAGGLVAAVVALLIA